MAFLSDEDKQQKDGEQGPEGGATQDKILSSTAGGFVPTGGSAPTAGTAGAGKAPSKSGVFTNLNNYVDANKGNDAAMGEKVKGVVDNTAQNASNQINTLTQTGQSEVQKGTVQADQNVVTGLQKDPAKVNKQQFQTQYNASYGGPNDATQVTGYSGAKQATDKVGQQTQAATAQGMTGRSTLLNDAYASPNYSRGEKNLDSYILGTGEGGKSKLREIADTYRGFGDNLAAAEGTIGQQIQQGRDTTQATRDATRGAYNQATGDVQKYFKTTADQVAAKNKQNAETAALAEQRLKSPNIEERNWAYQQLGMDPGLGEFMRENGYQFGNYATRGGAQALGDVADQGKIDTYNALMGLLDQSGTMDFSKTGASGKALDVNEVQRGSANELYGINQAAAAKLADLQARRDQDFATARDQATQFAQYMDPMFQKGTGLAAQLDAMKYDSFLKTLGVSKDLAGASPGFLADYLKKNQHQLSLGDVMNDNERARAAELSGALAISPIASFQDSGDEGRGFSFDKTGYAQAMKKYLDENPTLEVKDSLNSGAGVQDSRAALYAEIEKLLSGK